MSGMYRTTHQAGDTAHAGGSAKPTAPVYRVWGMEFHATDMRPRIYVSGPISKGDREHNIERGIKAGLQLFRMGFAPFIPHLSHFAMPKAVHGTKAYEQWLEVDFSYISTCAAVLRLQGVSEGADREVAFARSLKIPIYYNVEDLRAIQNRSSA